METWNFGGPNGPDMARFVPSGPCHSLRFSLSPLTATHDNSVALLGPILGPFSVSDRVQGGSREYAQKCWKTWLWTVSRALVKMDPHSLVDLLGFGTSRTSRTSMIVFNFALFRVHDPGVLGVRLRPR